MRPEGRWGHNNRGKRTFVGRTTEVSILSSNPKAQCAAVKTVADGVCFVNILGTVMIYALRSPMQPSRMASEGSFKKLLLSDAVAAQALLREFRTSHTYSIAMK